MRMLSRSTVALAIALAFSNAHATTYQFRHYLPGLVASPSAAAQASASAVVVALSGGSLLGPAEVSWPYTYDLNGLLSVTGDPNYNASAVSWSVGAGGLPPGLTLGSNGVISGTPTTEDATGSTFQILASYKSQSGQQAYTIQVGGVSLKAVKVVRGRHACAITPAGGLKCWGWNGYGQLGNGTTTNSLVPIDVPGVSNVLDVAVGARHTCVVTQGGGVKCWGANAQGALGDGTFNPALTPQDVPTLPSGVRAVYAGNFHTCALMNTGTAKCWGNNLSGEVGEGTMNTYVAVPLDVLNLSNITSMSLTTMQTCALTSDHNAYCWGDNSHGELGDGTTSASGTPVPVMGVGGAVAQISAGNVHTCVLLLDGTAKCWGNNNYGELGSGDYVAQPSPATAPFAGAGQHFKSIYAGLSYTCGVTPSNGVKCWGNNDGGQLGDGTQITRPSPVDVLGLSAGVASIAHASVTYEAAASTCALMTDSRVLCWGHNADGQLGNGTSSFGVPTPGNVKAY